MSWSAYTDHLIGERLGPRTRVIYLRWVRDADGWFRERGWSLAEATATQIADFVERRVPNSHSSRGQFAAALKHYWNWTNRYRPPLKAIRVPPAPEMVCRAIEEDQARDVVKVATGWYPEGLAVLAGMYLALRRFEIAKMEWDRFDDQLAWYTVTGKYDKTATLPVHPHLRSELEAWPQTSPWVFPGRFPGRHVTEATIWDWTLKVGRAAHVDHLKPHELRHTALATANDRTGNLRSVQTFARHSKPGTTSGYTRTTAARLREVSDALDYT
jgi:integrase/recombinase XerD